MQEVLLEERGGTLLLRGQRDKGRADLCGREFYFTNYFICLELFQLELGTVSKRANTVVPGRGTPFRPPEATFHRCNGHALIALRKHEFPPAKYITKLIAPEKKLPWLSHTLRRRASASLVSSGARLRAPLYLPTHAKHTSRPALSLKKKKKRKRKKKISSSFFPPYLRSSFPLV